MSEKHELCILLVEDDSALRESTGCLLKDHFTQVYTAADVESAIQILQTTEVHAVLCDYDLQTPRAGLQIRKWLNQHAPQVAFTLLTGYAEDAELLACLEDDHFPILQKPAHVDELILPLRRLAPFKKRLAA